MSKNINMITFDKLHSILTLNKCRQCNGDFTIGDKILSKRKSRGLRSRYHVSCAEALNII